MSEQLIKASLETDADTNTVFCHGHWTLEAISDLKVDHIPKQFPKTAKRKQFLIDASDIHELDTSGALLLMKLQDDLAAHGSCDMNGLEDRYQQLLRFLMPLYGAKLPQREDKHQSLLYLIGEGAYEHVLHLIQFLSFVGELAMDAIRPLRALPKLMLEQTMKVIFSTGCQALAIVALLTFLVGVVLAYQIGHELRDYGANIYIVEVLGVSIFREFAPLITAIILAGRTSSAYTAELGTMRMNEEIDALETLGISPYSLLVFPKIIGLLISLPLLAVWADFFGVLGGMFMSSVVLDVKPYDFLIRFQHFVSLKSYLTGLSKTPVFALIIASVGCFQGLLVTGGSEEVGTRTTLSVVQAIFLIIICDAIFSIFFSWARI